MTRSLASPLLRAGLTTMVLVAMSFGFSPSATAQQDGGQDVSEADTSVAERCSTPAFRQFDFWVGEWEVQNPDGEIVGHNEIRRVSGGCALLENWEGAGDGTGVSINTYDAERERWTQRWVGSGATLWLEGNLEEGPDGTWMMVLTGTELRSTPRGEVKDRISWTPLDDDRVLQVWEVQPAGGGDWAEVFRGIYSKANPSHEHNNHPHEP